MDRGPFSTVVVRGKWTSVHLSQWGSIFHSGKWTGGPFTTGVRLQSHTGLSIAIAGVRVGVTGASCIQGHAVTVVLRKQYTHMEIPSTVVGWKSTSRHTVQKSGAKKTKLMRCGQKRLFGIPT